MHYRPITAGDDAAIAAIIRANLEAYHLDRPGTAYFDPELDHLSAYYSAAPARRGYWIAEDAQAEILGGVGIAAFPAIPHCAELQKLYLSDRTKGRGCGSALLRLAEQQARTLGYRTLYLETHTALTAAIRLYETHGFRQIPRPEGALHSTMDRFYQKSLLPGSDDSPALF